MTRKLFNLICLVLIVALSAPVALAQEPPPAEPAADALAEHVPGEVLIRFQPWVNSTQAAQHMAAMGVAHKKEITGIGVHLVQLPPGLSVQQALDRFSRRPGIEFVEPNYILSTQAALNVIEDEYDQWALENISAPAAWTEFDSINYHPLLAIVDTGITFEHPELANNIWENSHETGDQSSNGIDDDLNGFIDDWRGWDFINGDNDPTDDNMHGTAVSGTAAGEDNDYGIVGVCPWCQLVGVKVLDSNGSGSLDVVADGIVYAAQIGADVINLSLGATATAETLGLAVADAWNTGAVVVAAAGNNGAKTLFYPAAYPEAMAVASNDVNDNHSCFSNYSPDFISVTAPGQAVIVADITNQETGYGAYSGTSLSAPHVTGLAGLILSQDPNLTNQEVRSRIEESAVDLGPPGFDDAFGYGRIDALRAINGPPYSDTTPPDSFTSIDETATGYAFARKLVRDNYGTLHAIWHTRQEGPTYRIRHATSTDNGDNWIMMPDVFTSLNETYHPALATNGEYLFAAIPSKSGPGENAFYQIMFTRKQLPNGNWEPAKFLMGGATYHTVRPTMYFDPTNSRLHVLASSLDHVPEGTADLYYIASDDLGENWGALSIFNPSNSNSKTRYATLHAYGDHLYVVARTVTSFMGLFTYYYMYTTESTNGGATWVNQTQISSFLALTSGEYGISLAGIDDRIYMGYEVGSNLYFRRFDNGAWSDFETLETGDASNINKWPTLTQAPDGRAWLVWQVNGELFKRQYDGSTWAPKESIGNASYANFKLGTSGDRVEWLSTQCNGAPFTLAYDGIQLGGGGDNNPPQAYDQSLVTDEDTSLAIILTASDPENDPLTFSITTQPTHGTLSGSPPYLNYQPELNYNGPDSFTFTANDGSASSGPGVVTITVAPVNDPPTALPDALSTQEDTPLAITLHGTDVDGDPLTFTIASDPLYGSLSGTAPGLTYSPETDFSGADSFTFTVNDGTVDSAPAAVSISVTAANDPPTALDQSLVTDEDTSLAITLTASDPENDPLTFTITTQPAHGTLSGSPPYVNYLPHPDYNGPDSFTFTASDASASNGPATVSITVAPVNDPPTAEDRSDSTRENVSDTWTPLVSDVDGDDLTCSIYAGPGGGASASVNADCSAGTYTPPPGYSGTDSFTYQVCDGSACDQGVVSYTITASSLHIGDLDGQALAMPRARWDARVTVEVHDAEDNPLPDALVEGAWSDGAAGGGSCTTNSAGLCEITKANLKSNLPSVTFTVSSVAHMDFSYNPSGNHDPDGDSSGTAITVYQDGPLGNQPPQASFTYQCTDLACSFDGSLSSDSDGVITDYAWDFGDNGAASGVIASHTFSAGGTYPVSLTVTDDAGASHTETQLVAVGSAGTQVLHVGDLDGESLFARKGRWDASAAIYVHAGDESLLAGVLVSGTWGNGRAMSCTTGPGGFCTVTLANLKTSDYVTTFTVNDVTAPGWTYEASLNHDEEGDSDGNYIVIVYTGE